MNLVNFRETLNNKKTTIAIKSLVTTKKPVIPQIIHINVLYMLVLHYKSVTLLSRINYVSNLSALKK